MSSALAPGSELIPDQFGGAPQVAYLDHVLGGVAVVPGEFGTGALTRWQA
jgi:hypothetical protein